MNQTLLDQNYMVIKNFITPEYANELSEKFKQFSKTLTECDDGLVNNAPFKYNYPPFLELLFNKLKHVEFISGEKLFPTYCYTRLYKKGSSFPSHFDKPHCEISITLNLSKDCPWSFFIKTPKGKAVDVDLNPGDGILYLGTKAPHWREPYTGDEYVQVFLHYVRRNGPDNYCVFELIEFFKKNFDFSGNTVYVDSTGQ